MFNKVILIGRLGQNAEAKTAQNNKEYVVLDIATQESWNDKGDYENRTEWHRVYAWRNLSPGLSKKGSSSPWKVFSGIAR
jgi:single-strand DNA-binding protein